MTCILLIHWNEAEAEDRAARLRPAGYAVRSLWQVGPELLRELGKDPPGAIVIDLTRLPSHGCEVGLALRQKAKTRHVPLVFVEGDPVKVARIRQHLPDATYTSWSRIQSALRRAIAHPPAKPVVPESVLAGYSGTPLPKKLGIKAGSVVTLVEAPASFPEVLGTLPENVVLQNKLHATSDLILWFITSRRQLGQGMARMTAAAHSRPMWMIWPKKTSAMAGDLTQQIVRDAGLAAGMVDYKVCAVDDTWSGLLFRRRR